jgi:hypothetical protein
MEYQAHGVSAGVDVSEKNGRSSICGSVAPEAASRIIGLMYRQQTGRARRILSSALAFALLHQLGACPCGCIEGNLWVQTFLRLTSGASEFMAAAPVKPVPTSVDSRECDDDHADLTYVAGSNMNLTHAHSSFVTAWAPPPHEGDVSSTHRLSQLCVRGGIWQAPVFSARTLRAQLQIFLI